MHPERRRGVDLHKQRVFLVSCGKSCIVMMWLNRGDVCVIGQMSGIG